MNMGHDEDSKRNELVSRNNFLVGSFLINVVIVFFFFFYIVGFGGHIHKLTLADMLTLVECPSHLSIPSPSIPIQALPRRNFGNSPHWRNEGPRVDFLLDDTCPQQQEGAPLLELGTCWIHVGHGHVCILALGHASKDGKAGPDCNDIGLDIVDGQMHERGQVFLPGPVRQLMGMEERPREPDNVLKDDRHFQELDDDSESALLVHLANVGCVVAVVNVEPRLLGLLFFKSHKTLKRQ